MKRIIPLITLFLPFTTLAQPRTAVNITNATIFLNGAELSSDAKIGLPKGESDVLFTNIAGNVNQQSLTIGAESGVVVQSVAFQNNYLGDSALSPRAKMLRDSIALLDALQTPIQDKKAVIEEQLTILRENRKVAGANTSLSVAELQKLLDMTAARTTALLAQNRELESQSDRIQTRLALLRAQRDEEQRRSYTPGGSLLVKFYAPAATNTTINLSYVVPNAGWTPSYDLRADKVGDPVKLFYKASVYQNSGVRWNNVKLTLSTGNPAEGAEAPTLNPGYLSFYAPVYNQGRTNSIQISATRGYQAPIIDPENPGGRQVKTAEQIEKAPTRNSADIAALSTQVYQSSVNRYTTADATGINTTFDIDLPYSIPSDGQQHTVAIKTYELPATYRHFAVPRLDKDAFLQAQITKWEDLNLLPAATNVFFEGSYVGQGYIDMRNVRDTMNLSLGRDKKLIIRRERDKNFHSIKTIGTNQRQDVAYNISVRNTRKEAVHLVVLDQIPISNDNQIEVEEPQTEGAEYDTATGSVKWTIDMKPAELRTLRLGYIIKYPRGKTVSGM